MFTEESVIFGPPSGTPAQICAYMLSRPHDNYTDDDIIGIIVPAYFEVCVPVEIDPVVAIAQMLHETGNLTSFWSARPQRNPAGIGVNGRKQLEQPADLTNWAFNTQRQQWEAGMSFASWKDDAVYAHVGRLAAYALGHGQGTPMQQALVAKAMGYRPLPDPLRGSAPTLKPLGKVHNPTGQGWASPGNDYGQRIAAIAGLIIRLPG
jgi:hypothetical protein